MSEVELGQVPTSHLHISIGKFVRAVISNIFPAPWLWLASFAVIVFDIVAFHFSHKYYVDISKLWFVAVNPFICIPAAWWLSRGDKAKSSMTRPMQLFMMPAYLSSAMCGLVAFGYIVMANSNPMADSLLSHWDQVLGLSWTGYARFFAEHPWFGWISKICYNLMIKALLIVIAIAVIERQPEKATELIALTLITCLITTVIGAWFPAQGAMAYLADDKLHSMFPPGTGDFFIQELLEVRGSIPKYIDLTHPEGIVQFPSFHTICGILTIYGARGAMWHFIPALIFGLLLIAGTPVYGGHYFVDVIAGAVVTFSAIAVSQLMFMRKPTTEKIAL